MTIAACKIQVSETKCLLHFGQSCLWKADLQQWSCFNIIPSTQFVCCWGWLSSCVVYHHALYQPFALVYPHKTVCMFQRRPCLMRLLAASLCVPVVIQVAQQFGNIFSLRWGADKVVFVSGYKMVKEVLVTQGDYFLDRPVSPLFDEVFKGNGEMCNGILQFPNSHRYSLSKM